MIILRLLAGLAGLGISEGMKRSEIRRKADIINANYYANKQREEERRKRLQAQWQNNQVQHKP